MTKEFYERLGVTESASQKEIKEAYRQKAKELHPDSPGGNAEKFKEIGEAWDTLKDPSSRREYDNPQPQFNFRSEHFGGFSQQFEDIFAGLRQRQQIKRYRVIISVLDAINGKKITMNGNDYEIPPGVSSGNSFKINDSEQLVVIIQSDPEFQIQGYILHTSKDVPIIQCILGGKINVKTVCGSILKINLPSCSDHTTILRTTGYGMVHPQTGKRQDMLIHIKPIMPKSLTSEEKELYNSIRNLGK